MNRAAGATVKFFGQFLVDRGTITRRELLAAIEQQRSTNLRFDQYAIQLGDLSDEQVAEIRSEQTREDLRFGEIAVRKGFLSPERVQEILLRQKNDYISIGEVLVQLGYLTGAVRDAALEAFREEQEDALGERIRVPSDLPALESVEILADMTEKMFLRVVGLQIKTEGLAGVKPAVRGLGVNSAIRLQGDRDFYFVLSMSPGVAAEIYAALLDEAFSSQEDLQAGLDEFANLVCGNAATKLARIGLAVTISPPQKLESDDMFYSRRWSRGTSCPVFTPSGEIRIDFFFA